MDFLRSLRHLWRHRLFRKLVAVRVFTQGADGVLQIGTASYVLFSPQRQPDAWSIATVLAITLLPFSVLGPFVSTVLDRWSRRQIVVVADISRAVLALTLSGLVLTGVRDPGVQTAFFLLVLVALSVNRFVLAGLSAALRHTIDEDEILTANAVMPTIGPAGVIAGAGIATGTRLVMGRLWTSYQADALVFAIGALLFVGSVTMALRIGRQQLGPDGRHHSPTPRDVIAGLGAALSHLRLRRAAGLGLLTIGAQRVIYGMVTVGVILIYRNYFHELTDVDAALADFGVWAAATGAGFLLAAAVTPPVAARIGLRNWMLTVLLACAVLQVVPGSIFTKPTLVVASFLLGLSAQSLKISVDTLVQAHVDDIFKGRVFVIYDMIFNASLVIAAVIAALLLPANGLSLGVFIGLGGAYALVALWFWLMSRRVGVAAFRRGTEELTAAVRH